MTRLTIGKLARAAKTDNQTIRFYERIGVLSKPDRNSSGYRIYEETTIGRLQFIKRAKEAGFTLKEIKTLFSLAETSNVECEDVRQFVKIKITRVREQIKNLLCMETFLGVMGDQCSSCKSFHNCLILNELIQDAFEIKEKS